MNKLMNNLKMQFRINMFFRIITSYYLFCFSCLAIASESLSLTGKIKGFDGEPVPQSVIRLEQITGFIRESAKEIDVLEDGSYQLVLDLNQTYKVTYAAPGHWSSSFKIFNVAPHNIELDIQLQKYSYLENIENLNIFVYDNENGQSIHRGAMKKVPNGNFEARIKTNAKKIKYQVQGLVPTNSIQGTDNHSLRFDGYTDYFSILNNTSDEVLISVSPSKLKNTDSNFHYQIRKANINQQTQIKTAFLIEQLNQDEELAIHRYKGDKSEFKYLLKSEVIRKAVDTTDSLLEKQLLLAGIQREVDPSVQWFAIEAIEQIPPDSFVWSTTPFSFFLAVYNSAPTELFGDSQVLLKAQFDKHWDKVMQFVLHNPEKEQSATVLKKMYSIYKSDGQIEKAEELAVLFEKSFKNTTLYESFKKLVDGIPSRKAGVKLAEFSLANLKHSEPRITNQTFENKVYLLDIWATWCKPCLKEMPFIHEAYEKYHKNGFEILSISYDYNKQDVSSFRNGKWKMPWLHSFVNSDKDNHDKLFEYLKVSTIPVTILVDAEGKIIANGYKARGSKLLKTLGAIFNTSN